MMRLKGAVFLLSVIAFAIGALGAEYKVDLEQSFFGVVVYKEGIASGFAHNHLVFAKTPRISSFSIPDGKGLTAGIFAAEADVAQIFCDDYEVSKKWMGILEKAALISENVPLSEIKTSTRQDIEETMRGEEQLDERKYPIIYVKLLSMAAKSGEIGKIKTDFDAVLLITIHGITKELHAPANVVLDGNQIQVITSAELKFTDFGIKPVSTALGMVRNQDDFRLFVSIKGKRNP